MSQKETKQKQQTEPIKEPNIYLYYANIMDYFRVVSAMLAFARAKQNPVFFIICYFISFILDAFDGMVARAFNEKSKLGATLDMVTDRISTAGLLGILATFYLDYSHYFIFLIMLDVGSHWLQTHSSFMVNVKNDNHKALDERFWIMNFYYKNRYGLGIVCLGAEVFLLLLYAGHHYYWLYSNVIFQGLLFVNGAIYTLKQIISIVQVISSSQRIGNFDYHEAMEAMQKEKKAN